MSRLNSMLTVLLLSASLPTGADTPAVDAAPRYDADGRLQMPANYREWIYLTSGLDMSYRQRDGMNDHSMFDNVFVNPEAYRAFLRDGHWPDKTMLALEVRGATSKGSINQTGMFQSGASMGLEVHVRDTARFADGWAFFAFDGDQPAVQIPVAADCYACHLQHGAVDTTFVQFYPTLLGIATSKGTLSANYLRDQAAANKEP